MANKNLRMADRTVVFQPRMPELRKLEGWYKTGKTPLYTLWESSGTKLSFSKWLSRNGINTGDKLGKALLNTAPFDFKVTCAYKDINRCSSMYSKKYFTSCLAPGDCNEGAREKYNRLMPYLAMLYVPDKAGHIASRAFFALIDGVIYPFRFYGDHNLKLAFDTLSEQTGVPIEDKPVWKAITRITQRSAEFELVDRYNKNREYVYIDTTCSYTGE